MSLCLPSESILSDPWRDPSLLLLFFPVDAALPRCGWGVFLSVKFSVISSSSNPKFIAHVSAPSLTLPTLRTQTLSKAWLNIDLCLRFVVECRPYFPLIFTSICVDSVLLGPAPLKFALNLYALEMVRPNFRLLPALYRRTRAKYRVYQIFIY